MDRDAAPRYARPFVVVFLVTLATCAVVAVSAWPFSSWQLFSRLRADQQTGWQAVVFDRQAREGIERFAYGYRGFVFIVRGFSQRPPAQRNAICAAWLRDATQQFGTGADLLRIYRLQWQLSDRHRDRAAPATRTLAWTCSATGSRAAG